MKLIICVVNQDDTDDLIDALTADGHQATVISTTGGFLREGNATLLLGVSDEVVQTVIKIIQANCHTRVAYANPLLPTTELGSLHAPMPIEVQVGGAVVFVLDVERFERY
jgi:uncharacterized protein YaaQ